MELLQQQYPLGLFTGPYLLRPPTIGSFGFLPPEAYLPQVPQQYQQLGRIDCCWQAVNAEMHLESSSGGSYSPERQSWVEG